MRGRFITLEGGEGAGKSTQARHLASWLREQGIAVEETREPGGTPGADAIRKLLLDPDIPLTAMAEAHLFAAARADHVERRIKPALDAGSWVVSDRFIDSTLAYQGAAGQLGIKTVREINETAIGECWPDLTILLRTDVATGTDRALARDGGESDRFGSRDREFHTAVAEGFDALAAVDPDRFAIIDADRSIDAVTRDVQIAVKPLLP